MGSSEEPGMAGDMTLGLPGPAEEMPLDELARDELTLVNEDDE